MSSTLPGLLESIQHEYANVCARLGDLWFRNQALKAEHKAALEEIRVQFKALLDERDALKSRLNDLQIPKTEG